jgi:hypothetical protein
MDIFSEKRTAELIDKYRYCNVEDRGWDEYVVDYVREILTRFGWVGCTITWSHDYGFDAAIRGKWSYEFHELIIGVEALQKDDSKLAYTLYTFAQKLALVYDLATIAGCRDALDSHVSFYLNITGRRSDTTSADIDDRTGGEPGDEDYVSPAVRTLLEELQEDFSKMAEDACHDIAKMLDAEHDALTSDEAVWETITANEWHIPDEEEEGT